MVRPTLNRALIAALTAAVLIGLVPGTILLDRRLALRVENLVREELATAPRVLADREAMSAEMLAMHAQGLADTPALSGALATGAQSRAVELARAAVTATETAIVIGPSGSVWTGPTPSTPQLELARAHGRAIGVTATDAGLLRIALIAVTHHAAPAGVVGVAAPVDEAYAATLAALTRSDVVVLGVKGVAIGTLPDVPRELADSARAWGPGPAVHDFSVAGAARLFAVAAPLGDAMVVFVRDRQRALAIVPELRRTVLLVVGGALLVTIVLGAAIASRLARPAEALAQAADRLREGDFAAPVPSSAIREIDRMGRTFVAMRRALEDRLRDLEEANRELEQRQQRLAALQTELIQRDRLASSGRLVAEVAHEIRNPVANIRNCIEVIRRRLDHDPRAREFADLAIDELLRMHELAERMLDVHRPQDTAVTTCDAAKTVRDVASLVGAGTAESRLSLHVDAPGRVEAAIPPDALKQVLLNLVQNAREAVDDRGTLELRVSEQAGRVCVEIEDDGPGISEGALDRLFDPFFTTKDAVHGVGLGLFVAEGIVRRYGGRLQAANRTDGPGARFSLEINSAPRAAPHIDAPNAGDGP